jgi:hypothetical protein
MNQQKANGIKINQVILPTNPTSESRKLKKLLPSSILKNEIKEDLKNEMNRSMK